MPPGPAGTFVQVLGSDAELGRGGPSGEERNRARSRPGAVTNLGDLMFSRQSCLVAVPLLGVLGAVAVAGPASAAPTNPFGCRASVGRLSSLTGAPVVEPYVANPN